MNKQNKHGWTTAVIRQENGTADCVACVAAMATGTTVEEFKEWCGQEVGPFSDLLVIAYLLRFGIQMGTGFTVEIDNPAKYSSIDYGWPWDGNAAYLGVKSERFRTCGHAVLWNGESVLDPGHDEPQPLSRYEVDTIWPLYRLPAQEGPDPKHLIEVPETRTAGARILEIEEENKRLRERADKMEGERVDFLRHLEPKEIDLVTGEWNALARSGINVFAVELLVESIERRREALAGKALVIPRHDHNGEMGYVILTTELPEILREADRKTFASRVVAFGNEAFGPDGMSSIAERTHRFVEEALELAQSSGCTREEAHQLVEYVFARPMGEQWQEAGGVLLTLVALCRALGLDHQECGELELLRAIEKIDIIRQKHLSKPRRSPLPGQTSGVTESLALLHDAERGKPFASMTIQGGTYDFVGADERELVLNDEGEGVFIPWPMARAMVYGGAVVTPGSVG